MLPGLHGGLLIAKSQPPAYVTTFSASSSSVTVSGIQNGDVLILSAFNPSATSITATGFTATATSATLFVGYKTAVGGETSITATNATTIIVSIFRGDRIGVGAVGTNVQTSATINYPALTLQDTSGASIVACVGIINSTTVGAGIPSGYSSRASLTAAAYRHSVFDTVTGVTTFASGLSATLSGSANYNSHSLEIRSL